ncbi:MAG: hypothetical protein AAF251_06245 [Pseudomonadota bacterium]
MMNSDREIWAMALWVEKHHGENGWFYITQQQDRLLADGQDEGVKLWREVGERFKQISADTGSEVKLN